MSRMHRNFFLNCFLGCAVTGMIIDVGDDSDKEREDEKTQKEHEDEVELYHPGSPFSHITRLGRFHHDKDDIALLTKAEQAFTDRKKSTDKPASLEQTVEKPDVIWMPSSYNKVLREHQREHRVAPSKKTGAKIAMLQSHQPPLAEAHAEGVPISDLEDPATSANGADSVVMPLRLLRSEYMGPMGIGTALPEHCRRPAHALMAGHGSTQSGYVSALDSRSQSSVVNAPGGARLNGPSDCTPRQQTYLNVVYDTGSTNIWIASDMCISGGCVLPGRRRFNHLESTTFSTPPGNPLLSVEFGTGKLSGPLGIDNLRVGPAAVHQTFAMMQNQTGWIWEDVPIEGIVGLAFPSLANTGQGLPFFDSVIEQKVLKRNEFAFYISRENPAANAIMWGGVDSRFYAGRIEWFPVVDPHYWGLDLAEFRVGNVSFNFTPQVDTPFGEFNSLSMGLNFMTKPKHGPLAVLDTGTSVLGFSNMLMSNLLELLPEAPCRDVLEDGANGTQLKYPDMVFVLRNRAGQLRDFALTGRQYMSRDDKGDSCSPAVMTLDLPVAHGPGVVLGDVFLREYFSVYNRRDGTPQAADVGLARSKRTEDVVEHLKTLTDDQQSLLHA